MGFSLLTLLEIKLHHYSECWKDEEEKIVDLKISFAEINSPPSTFHWLEEDEFTFHGRRYDVISSKEENNFFIVKCYDDTKEGSLYEKLKEHNSTDENNFPANNKHTVLKKGIEYDHSIFSFCCLSPVSPAEQSTSAELFAPSAFRSVDCPPPWLG